MKKSWRNSLFLALLLMGAGAGYAYITQTTNVMTATSSTARNVLGEPLANCCTDPMTGFFRDGFCHTGWQDRGTHVVCAVMTREFLEYTLAQGNDLCTARPEYSFPGLAPGDKWCLCVSRWKEAMLAGVAPPVELAATHEKALSVVTLEELQAHTIK